MPTGVWQPVPLAPRSRVSVYRTPTDYFAERIRRIRCFAYARPDRDYWVALERLHRGEDRDADPERRALARELERLLAAVPLRDPDLFVATSHLRYPGSDRLEAADCDDRAILERIASTLPAGYVPQDGQLWKRATIDGEIRGLYHALEPLEVCAVGPDWLAPLGERAGLPRFAHLVVDAGDAMHRERLLERIRAFHAERRGEPAAYLFHAGWLGAWSVLRLHGALRNAFLLDMGSALELAAPERLFAQGWGRLHRRAIASWWGLEAGGRDSRRYFRLPPPREAVPVAAPARARSRRGGAHRGPDRRGPVRFVEDKPVDFDFVRATLELSARANHWANFGPVTTRLEESLASFLGLPPERRVVMCASGTAALFALGGLHHHRAGRPLRWAVSAFGFFPSRQGPFADAHVLDCDADGLLDRDALAALPDGDWDAALVTNVFGALADPGPWLRLARERGKVLVLDSALALDAPYRDAPDVPAEIVSFHHTKPWGMGEGGCVLVDREDEDVVRSILNFGAHPTHATHRVSFNGKISDFASAFILQRLRDFSDASERHHLQYERVVSVARRVGYAVLGGNRSRESGATPGHVPLLAPHPVPSGALDNRDVVLRKYYQPLAPHCPRAADLYQRIVNVPCHPGLERLSEERLERCLADVLARGATADARSAVGARAPSAALQPATG